MRTAELLAHQGGWDEVLMVLGPVIVFVYLLWLARRRALLLAEQEAAAAEAASAADD